jgi:hypothetical protein
MEQGRCLKDAGKRDFPSRPITTPFGYFGSAFHADGALPTCLDNIEQKAGITLLLATAGPLTR